MTTIVMSRARECPACKTPLPEEAQFCLRCGHATPPDPGVPPRTAVTGEFEVSKVTKALASRYKIERVLGEGGMATVYLAMDLKYHRSVAIKVMRPELASTMGADRFLREVEIAARLTHPHILSMYESGDADGLLYYVMPYVEGETLRDRIHRETQLPVEDALKIAREVSEALAYAHEHGVIHRDIKPANILLGGGHAMVADFGIARALSNNATEALTQTGLSVGTPHYMAPEQAMGEREVDGRADIYAVGALLYEMIAGEPPFTGPTPQAIVTRSMTENPRSLTTSRTNLVPDVDQVAMKALAKSPADRYQTAKALAAALDQALDVSRSGPRPIVASSQGKRLRVPAMVLVGVLVILATAFAIARRPHGAAVKGARLVVLPFTNRGAAEDAYFADGIADEVRGKLAGLGTLQLIARSSSDQYRASTKSPKQIGAELGADYLLTATVRWAKAADGTSRVQVVPELIDARTGDVTWQQSYDASLTDVFQVQTQIASRVAGALGVALGSREETKLGERPTANLAAYDLYLKGRATPGTDPASLRRATAYYEQAVALDSSFTDAWVGLSRSLGFLYSNATPDPVVARRSLAAAEQALRLDPNGPQGHAALARYNVSVTKNLVEAKRDLDEALRLAPNNPEYLSQAGVIERTAGRWDDALAHAQQALRLDPRSASSAIRLQTTYLWLRRYPEALGASEAALALAPGDLSMIQDKSMVYVAQGDLPGARAVMREVSPDVTGPELVAYFSNYWDMYWVLDESQQQLALRLTSASFDNDRNTWATVLMELYWLRGDRTRARAYADSAWQATQAQLRVVPGDAQRQVIGALQLAYMGRKDAAIALGLQALALSPISRDRVNGPYYQQLMARVYLMVGESEKALDMLEPLLSMPYFLSPGWLKIDPTFAELKGNPRYDRLLK
jgi:TolB-like protein/tRNA A-37 threonylcarbamoyl transferase component Bud32/Flp pilus assembly protein TadD